jgi:hypothetical protein
VMLELIRKIIIDRMLPNSTALIRKRSLEKMHPRIDRKKRNGKQNPFSIIFFAIRGHSKQYAKVKKLLM